MTKPPGSNPDALTATTTTTTPPSEILALAQTPDERELLAHFLENEGEQLTRQRANLVLKQARAIGDV